MRRVTIMHENLLAFVFKYYNGHFNYVRTRFPVIPLTHDQYIVGLGIVNNNVCTYLLFDVP